VRDLIEQSSNPGELVIDPFAGSSSTIIAAFECKRQAWGCELDKEYYGQGLLRIEAFASKGIEEEVTEEVVKVG
jgi:site-specific DNA-methyltransferase (adenine-specific)